MSAVARSGAIGKLSIALFPREHVNDFCCCIQQLSDGGPSIVGRL